MFTGSRLKMERAKKHIADLHNDILFFTTPDSYLLTIEKHPDTGNDALKFKMTKPFPENLALVIGDAIHNLHTALDLAVCEIVRNNLGEAATGYFKFPFYKSRDNLIKGFKRGKIAQASSVISNFNTTSVEP